MVNKSKIPWNKGKKTGISPWRGKSRSEDTKKKIADKLKNYFLTHSSWMKGKKVTPEQHKRLIEMGRNSASKRIGKPLSEATRDKLSKKMFGRRHSAETIAKLKKILGERARLRIGIPRSAETKLKISLATRGRKVTKKQLDRLKIYNTNRTTSEKTKQKISEHHKRTGVGKWMKGRHLTEETKKKLAISSSKNAKRGKNSSWWKGGISTERDRIYRSPAYREWIREVLSIGNFSCAACDKKPGDGKRNSMSAHHIKPFSLHPEDRFNVKNGVCLCWECHKKVDAINSRLTKNYKNKIENYFSDFKNLKLQIINRATAGYTSKKKDDKKEIGETKADEPAGEAS